VGFFRELGRLCLSAVFIINGYQAVKDPGYPAKRAEEELDVPDPVTAAKANGTAMMLAGGAIALNMWTRIAEFVLALSLIPTTLAGHPFWKEQDPQQRRQQAIHFEKNLALFGAMLLLITSRRRR
jgi:putative oxidoreductase